VFLGFFYQLIDVPAILVLGFWFVLQILDGIVSTGPSAGAGIAFFAHIGGFVAGALAARLVILLGVRRRPAAPPASPGPPAPPSAVPPSMG
jgi:membrane associated rhomboid family serine protease